MAEAARKSSVATSGGGSEGHERGGGSTRPSTDKDGVPEEHKDSVAVEREQRSGSGGSGDPQNAGEASSQKRGSGERKRKDGTRNKMSFDVDELEEGLYIEVEDEEDVEEVVEYEEIPDDEVQQESVPGTEGGAKETALKSEKLPGDMVAVDENIGYKIRPDLSQKFRPGTVQIIIERAIKELLEGKQFTPEECEEWMRLLVEDIHEKVKSQNYRRYKIITHVTIGERRGEGASSATRCLWDAEADCMATYTFLNDSMFCNGTVYGIYFY